MIHHQVQGGCSLRNKLTSILQELLSSLLVMHGLNFLLLVSFVRNLILRFLIIKMLNFGAYPLRKLTLLEHYVLERL